ncbi:MAG: TldD/PmbA family protein, partial [Firmicutes bacterium]|nr:TldD/PmbA family protein [Bacillota bacterium]
IVSASIRYFDKFSRLHFANSEGSYIEQEKMDMGCNVAATAAANGQSQSAHTGFGGSNDFSFIVGKEKEVEEVCHTAISLMRAEPIVGGQYPVILDPHLAGVFIHEAFGHLSESDGLHENENMRKVMTLGTRFGQEFLNVYDSGLDEGARGHLVYDDEGVRTQKTYLIKNGVLVGRLHSRETAGKMGEEPTGNARAITYQFPPIVRMRNTCIEPGEASFEDLLRGVNLGVYAKGAYGGQTNGEMFTFTAGEAYMIRLASLNGQVAELVKDVTLTGNVFRTLKNIDLIGRDFTIFDSAGGCGKGGQMPLPVSHWAPHVRIQNVVIGGKK